MRNAVRVNSTVRTMADDESLLPPTMSDSGGDEEQPLEEAKDSPPENVETKPEIENAKGGDEEQPLEEAKDPPRKMLRRSQRSRMQSLRSRMT